MGVDNGESYYEQVLMDEVARLREELAEVQTWFVMRRWEGYPDPSGFGGHPYTENERALGYGTYRDPRFLPKALSGLPG